MDEFFTMIGVIVMGVIVIIGVSVISGTIIWILWPYVIPNVFPGLVEIGHLPSELGWWTSVLFSWFTHSIFPTGSNVKSK